MDQEEIKRLKQQYATPWSFIDWVVDEILVPRGRGFFGIDVCADDSNRKAADWLTEEHDGLANDWRNIQNGPAWCNPPFKDVAPWLRKARHEAETNGVLSCVLTHMDHSTEWYNVGMANASEVVLINPRINFIQHPLYRKYMEENGIKPSGNDKQNALWIFDPAWLPSSGEQARITYPKPWR